MANQDITVSVSHADWRKRFTHVDNDLIEDVGLSWQARGLLIYLLSKPDDWAISFQQLLRASPKNSRGAMAAIFKELVHGGYAQLKQIRDSTGHRAIGQRYVVTEKPFTGMLPSSVAKEKISETRNLCAQKSLRSEISEIREIAPLVKTVRSEVTTERLELKTEEEKKENTSVASSEATPIPRLTPSWLVAQYNLNVPDNWPKVRRLSEARYKKALVSLRQFDDPAFWQSVWQEIHLSPWLLGECQSDSHPNWKPTFDFLLAKGGNGTENCVMISEGHHRKVEASRRDAKQQRTFEASMSLMEKLYGDENGHGEQTDRRRISGWLE